MIHLNIRAVNINQPARLPQNADDLKKISSKVIEIACKKMPLNQIDKINAQFDRDVVFTIDQFLSSLIARVRKLYSNTFKINLRYIENVKSEKTILLQKKQIIQDYNNRDNGVHFSERVVISFLDKPEFDPTSTNLQDLKKRIYLSKIFVNIFEIIKRMEPAYSLICEFFEESESQIYRLELKKILKISRRIVVKTIDSDNKILHLFSRMLIFFEFYTELINSKLKEVENHLNGVIPSTNIPKSGSKETTPGQKSVKSTSDPQTHDHPPLQSSEELQSPTDIPSDPASDSRSALPQSHTPESTFLNDTNKPPTTSNPSTSVSPTSYDTNIPIPASHTSSIYNPQSTIMPEENSDANDVTTTHPPTVPQINTSTTKNPDISSTSNQRSTGDLKIAESTKSGYNMEEILCIVFFSGLIICVVCLIGFIIWSFFKEK